MRSFSSLSSLFPRKTFLALVSLLLLAAAAPSFGAELAVEYTVIARSGVTSIPGGVGKFTGFGAAPAIDEGGNVVFVGAGGNDASGKYQSGVYTAVGVCCQKVADRNTAVPGQGGVTFDIFRSTDRNDIDGGRVAFTADISASTTLLGVYSNVGQASASSLVEVAVADGTEWSILSDPWVDGTAVALRGRRLIPSQHDTILVWDGADSFLNPGTGYVVSPGTVASMAQDAAVFRRAKSGYSELGVQSGGVYQTLVLLNSTPIPAHPGVTFSNVNNFPVVDRGGLDVAFRGNGPSGLVGLYKRANGGALTQVADNATVVPGGGMIPGAGAQIFKAFIEDGMALANGQVVFWGAGLNFLEGLYTDIGGELTVLLDSADYNTIELNGVSETLTGIALGHKALTYTSQGYEMVFRALFASGGSAIIRATIDSGSGTSNSTFTVRKDFSDNNTASVSITLTCTSGTVTNNPQLARESVPAVFNISGASAGATCTATEPTVPAGYTRNQTDCQNGDPLNGSCTIVNTLNTTSGTFTVYKDFSDNNSASVSVTASCSSGTVTNSPQTAREGAPAVFNVTGALAGATCTATEPTVPAGYTRNQTDCQNGDPLNGSCTIVNTLNTTSGTFTVYKDFSDNSTASVSVTASCSSGTVTNSPQTAREGVPAVFNITGALAGATCTATEPTVPAGYTRNQTDCQNGDPLNGSCTIVNTKNSHTFTVHKDFEDDIAASVSISLSCTSGTVTNSPRLASEGTPAVFNISGASTGATCTASEPTVPTGYTKNEADCQNGDPLNGSCTIVNTPDANRTADVIASSGFETGGAEGWSLTGGAKVDGTVAIGQYALLVENNGTNSVRSVSTTGYSGVSVTVNLAAMGLQKSDVCHAELSTNGGSTWSSVLQVGDGLDNGTFRSASVSPSAASDNANLRLRVRMAGKGKGDKCWGDEIVVRGTPMSSTLSSAKAPADSLQRVATGFEESAVDSGAIDVAGGYGSRGFDPGFDNLFGDGEVARDVLTFDVLMSGRAPADPVARSAFAVPAGAAQPSHLFEGGLELLGSHTSSGTALPAFNYEFVQLDNHLYPLGRGGTTAMDSQWGYVIDTGRVWRESGDQGFSRAAIPFALVQHDTGCMQLGTLTFLFRDDGATSKAVYQMAGSCETSPFDGGGSLEAVYTPASLGNQALGIESVMGCAADTWLPLVQGRGGITMVLTADDSSHFVLSEANQHLWLDAAGESAAISALCD